MHVRFNGNFEVFDDNNEIIAKKNMDIIGSEFYPAEDIPNRIWSPRTIQLSDDLLLECEITIQSKLRSKK